MSPAAAKSSSANSQPQTPAADCRPGLADAGSHRARLCLLLAAATLAVFWPVVNCGFLTYDDPVYFTENSRVQTGLTWAGVSWAFRTGWMGNWHPAVWLSYMLDVAWFGNGPAGPHFTNLLLHVANAILLFLLLRTLTGERWRSWLVAALFALHPLRVESVAWVSERKDVLSAFFGLLALLMYGRYARKRSRVEGRESGTEAGGARDLRPPTVDYCLAWLFFALALMSKAMLVTLPFVMLLLDYWPLQRLRIDNWRAVFPRLVLEKTPFFASGLIVGAITFLVHQRLGALTTLAASSLTARLENAVVACTCYLGRTFCPVKMALPYPRVEHWPLDIVFLSGLLVAGVCVAAVRLGRKQPYVFAGWFWFVGMLVPVSGIIQWGEHSMADRFTYLPAIGLFILAVWVIGETVSEWRLAKAAPAVGAGLVLGACAVGTRVQLTYWANSETLFRHALAVTQNNYVAYCNLGMFFAKQGRMDEAAEYFASALNANPNYAPALNNLGATLMHEGRVAEAEACIEKSIQLGPYDVSAHFNLGQVQVAQGKLTEAVGSFAAALHLKPDYFAAHKNLAAVLIRLGRTDEAVQHLRLLQQQQPEDAEVLSNLGSALAVKGELDEAVLCFRRAIRCSPARADTHLNLGTAFVTQHRPDEAILEFKEALRLKPGYPEAKQQLRALGVNAEQ